MAAWRVWLWHVLPLVVGLAAATPEYNVDFSGPMPQVLKKMQLQADAVARERLAAKELESAKREQQSQKSQHMQQLADRKYRQALGLVRTREVSSEVANFKLAARRMRKQEQQLLHRALALEQRASAVERLLGAKHDQLGEARDDAETHAIRAAQMRGRAARWQMKALRWKTGAEQVQAVLDKAAKAEGESKLQAENDKILRTEDTTNAAVAKLHKQEEANRAEAISSEQHQSRARQVELLQQLHQLKARLDAQQRTNKEQSDAVRQLLKPVQSLEHDSVFVRDQLNKVLSEQTSVIEQHGSTANLEGWNTPKDELLQIQQMEKQQQELNKAKQQATSAEHEAIELLVNSEQQLGHPAATPDHASEELNPNAGANPARENQSHEERGTMLGEADKSPRTMLLAQAKAKRELERVKRQQRSLIRQVERHAEMKTKLLVKDAKITNSLKSKRLTNQLDSVEHAIQQAELAFKSQKVFIKEEIQDRLARFQAHAMGTVVDVTKAIRVSAP